ncbi:uncharacterized protein [Clytia hemisphaerica]|uniref:BTB domain-containing protein n=1 Tax=Clytia hemisphaerica TaxID=252671 RepID=A0A7M5UW86_9CNID
MGEHKDIQETVLFDFKKDDCDVSITSKNKLLLVTSAFLKYVLGDRYPEIVVPSSKAIQNEECGFKEEKSTANGEEEKENHQAEKRETSKINMAEIGSESIIYALSFYQPMFFKEQDVCGSEIDHDEELLQLCNSWSLNKLKKRLESNLMERFTSSIGTHNYADVTNRTIRLSNYATSKNMTGDQLSILFLADKYDLNDLYLHVMSKYPTMDPEEMNESLIFPKLKKLTKYELIRNTLMNNFRSKKSLLPEVTDIFRFLDVYLYEGRIIDLSVQKPFERTQSFQYDPREKEKFLAQPADDSFVVLVVEGMRLYVESFTLVNHSPVFKKMLETASRDESGKKVLAMPGNDVNQVAHLLTYLSSAREIGSHSDVVSLASLAEKFQIKWLMNKIEVFLKTVQEDRPEYISKYLKLQTEYKIVNKNVSNQIHRPDSKFTMVDFQVLKGFSVLTETTKIRVAVHRLWFNFKEVFDIMKTRVVFNELISLVLPKELLQR